MAIRESFVVTFRAQGADAITRATKRIQASLQRVGATLARVTKMMAGAGLVAATAFTAALVKARGALDETAKAAKRVGTSVENMNALKQAASEGAISFEELQRAMIKLQKIVTNPSKAQKQALLMAGFDRGGGEVNRYIKDLGPSDLFQSILESIQNVGSPGGVQNIRERNAVLSTLFGERMGAKLATFDTRRVGQLMGENRALGLDISDAEAGTAERIGDIVARIFDKLSLVMQKISASPQLESALMNAADALDQAITAMGGGAEIARQFGEAVNGAVNAMRTAVGIIAPIFDFSGTVRGTARGRSGGVPRVGGAGFFGMKNSAENEVALGTTNGILEAARRGAFTARAAP